MVRPVPSRVGPYEVAGGFGPTGVVHHASRAGVGYALHRVKRPGVDAMARLDDYRACAAETSGLARLVDVLDDGDDLALVFELREGVSLARLLSHLAIGAERLDDAVIWYVADALARTLASMHGATHDAAQSKPLIHGRVSPERVLVTWGGDVVLLGVCPLVDAELPFVGGARDAAAWLAPEVRRGSPADASSDVFSVALLVRTLVSGDDEPAPDAADTPLQLVLPELRAEVAFALDRGLSSNPGERLSARELSLALASMVAPASEGRLALVRLVGPLEDVGRLWSTRASMTSSASPESMGFGGSSSGSLEETFPTIPRSLSSGPSNASTARPEPTTLPSEISVAPSSDQSSSRALDEPDVEAASLRSDDLESTLLMAGLEDDDSLYATRVVEPVKSSRTMPAPRAVPPPRPRSPSLAPPAAPGILTVVDDGARGVGGGRPSLPKVPAHAPSTGALVRTPAMAPAKSSSTLPVAPVASAFEASAREVAAIVPATDVGDRSARDALGHADDAVLERVPDSLPPPPPPGAEDADEGSTVMLPAPDVSIGPTAAGSGDAGRFEDVAAVPAAAVFHEPEVALPRMAAAVKPTQRARPEANASRRGRSVVVSLVVLLVVWGVAFGLYVRDRGKKRAEASTVVATAADAASPSPASGAPAAPLPSESGASTVLEALATASAAVAPSALASSEGASEARDPGGASSSAPSAASSSGALPPIIDAPGADRKLLSFEAHLVVRSSVDANVYVQGVVVGRTNQRTIARCRWRNVRLGVEPGPFWISKLQTEHLPCEGSHTVTIETDPGLVAAERARSR